MSRHRPLQTPQKLDRTKKKGDLLRWVTDLPKIQVQYRKERVKPSLHVLDVRTFYFPELELPFRNQVFYSQYESALEKLCHKKQITFFQMSVFKLLRCVISTNQNYIYLTTVTSVCVVESKQNFEPIKDDNRFFTLIYKH